MTIHDREPVMRWVYDLTEAKRPEPEIFRNFEGVQFLITDTVKMHWLTKLERLYLWAGFTDVKTLNEKYR
jgi:hypothetical protein